MCGFLKLMDRNCVGFFSRWHVDVRRTTTRTTRYQRLWCESKRGIEKREKEYKCLNIQSMGLSGTWIHEVLLTRGRTMIVMHLWGGGVKWISADWKWTVIESETKNKITKVNKTETVRNWGWVNKNQRMAWINFEYFDKFSYFNQSISQT